MTNRVRLLNAATAEYPPWTRLPYRYGITTLACWHLGTPRRVTAVGRLSPAARRFGQTRSDTLYTFLKSRRHAVGTAAGVFGVRHARPDAQPMIGCGLRGTDGTTHARYPELRYHRNADANGYHTISDHLRHTYYFR